MCIIIYVFLNQLNDDKVTQRYKKRSFDLSWPIGLSYLLNEDYFN